MKLTLPYILLLLQIFGCSQKHETTSFSLTEQFKTPYSREFSNETITHYFRGNLILYEMPMDFGKSEYGERYFLKDTANSKALMYMPFETIPGFKPVEFKQMISIVDFEDITGYKHNLGLAQMVSLMDKKLFTSKHSTHRKWQDIYIMPKNSNDKLDSIIIWYDSKLVFFPFSFNPLLDKIHNSRVSSLRVVYHGQTKKEPNDGFDYRYEIKEEPIKNPAKIDSIFTKLIPYLPKK